MKAVLSEGMSGGKPTFPTLSMSSWQFSSQLTAIPSFKAKPFQLKVNYIRVRGWEG